MPFMHFISSVPAHRAPYGIQPLRNLPSEEAGRDPVAAFIPLLPNRSPGISLPTSFRFWVQFLFILQPVPSCQARQDQHSTRQEQKGTDPAPQPQERTLVRDGKLGEEDPQGHPAPSRNSGGVPAPRPPRHGDDARSARFHHVQGDDGASRGHHRTHARSPSSPQDKAAPTTSHHPAGSSSVSAAHPPAQKPPDSPSAQLTLASP